MQPTPATCLTCYGAGETVSDLGPQACPDCFGEGKALSQGTKMEWRLRAIERAYASPARDSARETEADVKWLVHELRRSRDALTQILARCQDADPSDATAQAIKFKANEALGVYEPQ